MTTAVRTPARAAGHRLRLFGAWCGPGYVAAVIGGWALLAGYLLPPHAPSSTAQTIARFYQDHTMSVRIGTVILMFAALASVYFSAAVTRAIMDGEGGFGFISLTSLLGGAALMVLTFYPATFYLIAAYRPDRAPDLILLMNDIAWLQLIGGISIYLAQPTAIAIAAFTDRRDEPIFPRWVGYYNVWTILLFLPGQLLFFFHDGPFAWNGLFALWIPAGVFGLWFLVMGHVLTADLNRRTSTDQPQHPTSSRTEMVT